MPEVKIGKCPFCDRENQRLYLITGRPAWNKDGYIELPVEYVCGKCKGYVEAMQGGSNNE